MFNFVADEVSCVSAAHGSSIASILLYLVRFVYKIVTRSTEPGGAHRTPRLFQLEREVHDHDSEVLGILEGSLEKGCLSHLMC